MDGGTGGFSCGEEAGRGGVEGREGCVEGNALVMSWPLLVIVQERGFMG